MFIKIISIYLCYHHASLQQLKWCHWWNLNKPLMFNYGVNTNAIYSAFELYLIWKSCYRLISITKYVISSLLFAHRCHAWMLFPFPMCFYFSPVGSGVDASNEIEWATLTINIYPSMRKSRRTMDIYFIWLSKTRQASPLWTYGFKVFQNIIFCTTRFNYLLSIDRVILSNECSILVAEIPWSTAPSMTRFCLCVSLEIYIWNA
jgi:hypothetical protein